MAYINGTATNYHDLLDTIRTHVEVTLPVLERWVVLEEVTTGIDRYTIWKAPGLDGTKEIFMGLRTYESIPSDYYNYEIAGFTGYTPGNTWETQPGYNASCIPLWNGVIPYWIVANGQRLILVANVESNYVSLYMGFMLPFATPGQYPYPIAIGACLNGSLIGTRYSDTSYNNWWKGSYFAVRYTGVGWVDSSMTAYASGYSTHRNTIASPMPSSVLSLCHFPWARYFAA